jgi:Na+/proline symporter/signal transduction histidine kinase/CheY-like chemotaxis protein
VSIGWIAVVAAIVYIAALFAVAWFGDRRAERGRPKERPLLYALAISVYCTSWTFFGSVGVASRTGLDFLPIYIGPILMFTVGYPLLKRVIRVSKAERITSVADFLGARYGKSQTVAAVATLIAMTAVLPYIALQLKAVSTSLAAMLPGVSGIAEIPVVGDLALLVAAALALFAILFGTRHADATEHQNGMVLAIAVEAVVKLLAFLAVGAFITFVLFDGPLDLYAQAAAVPELAWKFTRDLPAGAWISQTVLAAFACLLLPRQFHIAVVENNSPGEIRRAAWLFPLYLVAINIFVVPIAAAGLLTLGSTVDPDLFVLEVPRVAGAEIVALVAFIGGLSAATAMVIVASVALAIMISNEIVVPLLLRGKSRKWLPPDMGGFVLNVRRASIILILLLGYAYYRVVSSAALASIGLVAFAAIAQLGPAFFGGLLWRRATASGAVAGMAAGFAVWAYTLLLPTFVYAGFLPSDFVEQGPFGISALRPQALFGTAFDPVTHGVLWSLLANTGGFVAVSLSRPLRPIERLQTNVFVPLDMPPLLLLGPIPTGVKVGELMDTVARYLGEERSRRSFERFAGESGHTLDPKTAADLHILRFSEQLLASAIGAASARLVLSLLVSRDDPSPAHTQRLLDDAEQALHYNRDLLQTVLDRVDQGIAAFDRELRLVCWNRLFRQHLDLPAEFGQVGVSLSGILGRLARNGLCGPGDAEGLADRWLQDFAEGRRALRERHPATGRILAVEPRPSGDGLTLVVTDITEQTENEAELVNAKATLEKRVAERTEELMRLNAALERATAAAEEANISKTRFLAAAGHDILQPLNAARLYATALAERTTGSEEAPLAGNVGVALDGVEDILRAVLEISRLDSVGLKPDIRPFRIQELLDRMRVDFDAQARAKGVTLVVVGCGLAVQSDPQLLGRLLQNLVSNAIKYTPHGRVLVGCRRKRDRVVVEVVDTGIGIAPDERKTIFKEFLRLDSGARVAPGLGLGLSIVERIAKILNVGLAVDSAPGQGTRVSLTVPLAASAPVPVAARAASVELSATAGMVVLCIDNDERILAGMNALLSGWGCAPILAKNAREALRLTRSGGPPPDLMLVDYHLDEGDGLAAIAEIRRKLGDEIPAILVTADRSAELKEQALHAGIRVLNKPVKPAALRALMAQWNVRRPAAE